LKGAINVVAYFVPAGRRAVLLEPSLSSVVADQVESHCPAIALPKRGLRRQQAIDHAAIGVRASRSRANASRSLGPVVACPDSVEARAGDQAGVRVAGRVGREGLFRLEAARRRRRWGCASRRRSAAGVERGRCRGERCRRPSAGAEVPSRRRLKPTARTRPPRAPPYGQTHVQHSSRDSSGIA